MDNAQVLVLFCLKELDLYAVLSNDQGFQQQLLSTPKTKNPPNGKKNALPLEELSGFIELAEKCRGVVVVFGAMSVMPPGLLSLKSSVPSCSAYCRVL